MKIDFHTTTHGTTKETLFPLCWNRIATGSWSGDKRATTPIRCADGKSTLISTFSAGTTFPRQLLILGKVREGGDIEVQQVQDRPSVSQSVASSRTAWGWRIESCCPAAAPIWAANAAAPQPAVD